MKAKVRIAESEDGNANINSETTSDPLNCDERNGWFYQAAQLQKPSKRASDMLGIALTRTNDAKPSGDWDAHHIIPKGSYKDPARDDLLAAAQRAAFACDIPPNGRIEPTDLGQLDSWNGVWLRGPDLALGESAYNALTPSYLKFRGYHPRMHTTGYVRWTTSIRQALKPNGGCDVPRAHRVLGEMKGILETTGEKIPDKPFVLP